MQRTFRDPNCDLHLLTPAQTPLAEALSRPPAGPDQISARIQQIHQRMLSLSPRLLRADFNRIGHDDLELMFRAYDQSFFNGLLAHTLNGTPLRFHLSTRMTKTGGMTKRHKLPSGQVYYEISVACSLLFDAFREEDRTITVAGLECSSRLEALQRIFEHELIHLAEMLCWTLSDCGSARFQTIAAALFGHGENTHNMVTRHERAARSGIHVGTIVGFSFEGKHLTGRVNRITKRATILVEDSRGIPYSDGKRYLTFYVPIRQLVSPPAPATEDGRVPRPAARTQPSLATGCGHFNSSDAGGGQ